VSNTENNEAENREKLKNKRKLLYRLFLKNPEFMRLAVEIKALDDQLAEWTSEDALALSSDRGQRSQERRPLLLGKVSNDCNIQKRRHQEQPRQILTGPRLRGQARRSA
jgi:hypothetical protein